MASKELLSLRRLASGLGVLQLLYSPTPMIVLMTSIITAQSVCAKEV